ncbi:uncharacterized protein TRIADDRAFT_62267 [Trichoplax adhaerens]|uniref:Uncharacterized protein n=1 Tax=Trichoplax adhaerens TaxID=10228 RepID=B3SDA9_TRIAD|nr:hypothetical protein TRIADDRAFT_62267 [Trichoplax adhaerens]EDV19312.1 hypothetical protein TRIADDRAFT_62267 [Trichoplax adhaerens]|eukprot:XP_002118236.1 hypothetical protein TRIADDRAFT_62267 [Trichoplax adhaerens]
MATIQVRTTVGIVCICILFNNCWPITANNLVSNPSFEDILSNHWTFQHRQSLWDLKAIKPNDNDNNNQSISITSAHAHHGNRSLMFTSSSTLQQPSQGYTPMLVATQFLSFDQSSTDGIHILYHHWYLGKGSCWKLMIYIRYTDNSYHQVRYSGLQNKKNESGTVTKDTFQPFCLHIPLYKSVRHIMISIMYQLHNPQCQENLYIDDISLNIIKRSNDSQKMDYCHFEQSSFPVRRHTWKRFQISEFTLHKKTSGKDPFITIATQMTIDRLPTLERLVQRWQGPISVVLFVLNDISGVTVQDHLQQVLGKYHQVDDFRKFIDLHIVFEDALNGKDSALYPVNFLRNLAIKFSKTSHVYLLDIDIIPSVSHEQAVAAIMKASHDINNREHNIKVCQKCAFITPLFKLKTDAVDNDIPREKNVLLEQIRKDNPPIEPFHAVSHAMTQFGIWFSSSSAFKSNYIENNEPYFIINRKLSPNINNIFSGYGRDKCAYAHEVHATGFEFVVLPHVFAVDTPSTGNSEILSRSATHGEFLPIDVFLNSIFHTKEVKEVYHSKRNTKQTKNDIEVKNDNNGKTVDQTIKKTSKSKKMVKKDMSGFGCNDALIIETESTAYSSRPQYVIVEKMAALYGTMVLIEFYSGGLNLSFEYKWYLFFHKFPLFNIMSHLDANIILKSDNSHQDKLRSINSITTERYGKNITSLLQQVRSERSDPMLFWIPTRDQSQHNIKTMLSACLTYAKKKDIIIIEDGRQESLGEYKDSMCQYKKKWRIKIEETVTIIKSPKVTGRSPVKFPPFPTTTQSNKPPNCNDRRYQRCFTCLKNRTDFSIQPIEEKPSQFGQKVYEILQNSTAHYIIYAVDEIIWLRPVNFSYVSCQLHAAEGKIASAQLRLGENIRPTRYLEERDKYKEQIFPVKYDSEILLMYPFTLPYDNGYVIHVDGIMMARLQLLEDGETYLTLLRNPMELENTWLWKKLSQRCRQWHLSYKTSRLVNNVLSDGRILDQDKPSEKSERLLKIFLDDGKRVDVNKTRQQLLRHTATHTVHQVDYISNSCSNNSD